MLKTLIGIIVGLLAFFGAGLFSYISLEKTIGPRTTTVTTPTIPQKAVSTKPLTTKASTAQPSIAKKASTKTISAPGPLRVVSQTTSTPPSSGTLTVNGVIVYTNAARAQNGGLPALTENQTLDRDAQMKVADMFAKQYFEHVSPTGVGPAELANTVGYAYVLVGENLALGGFSSDQDVVTAWMNSPGHRANILNSHYQEIGVAVGKGMYEGRETWLAVQSFGMPRSACPLIDEQLKIQIDANNTAIIALRAQLDAKKAQIDATPTSDPNYNTYVNEFNALVPQYNSIVETNRVDVANYNAQVNAFNNCTSAASASATAH